MIKHKTEVVLINKKDGFAQCDSDDVIETLEMLTGKPLKKDEKGGLKK